LPPLEIVIIPEELSITHSQFVKYYKSCCDLQEIGNLCSLNGYDCFQYEVGETGDKHKFTVSWLGALCKLQCGVSANGSK